VKIPGSPQTRIVLVYLVVGTLWIYFSDRLIAASLSTPEAITAAQNVKGWFFILITSAMLYLLVQEHFRTLKNKHRELVESYDQTIRGWIEVMDLRHHETRNHTERVTRMTVAFARLAGVNPERLERIARGATLHDIGKIGIPDSILIKPGKLDPDEWALMQTHPDIGRELLEKISFLRPCIDIPWCHHEKWDGSGYPRGLRGAEIPLAARLFAIVDVWDALTHKRVYKDAWPEEAVLDHIREQAGRHFDPGLVDIFIANYAEIKREAGVDSGLSHSPRSRPASSHAV
tara:strand:- start:279 stop:1142 length:864 start_codon:yes stop_codon:yes gene_type:complete